MGGIVGCYEICLVTPVACCGESCVVVVGVALRAGDSNVRASERERGVVVIEGGGCPRGGVVASCAGGRESGSYVGRIRCSSVVRLVAGVTVSRQSCVVVIDVALSAREGGVRSGQGERRGVVIECGTGPCSGAVACCAGGWEADGGLGGAGGSGVVCLVARVAISRQSCVVVIDVALSARDGCVCSGQGERRGVVIKCSTGPVGGAVAIGAGGGEAYGSMWRAVGSGVVCLVA